MNIFTIKTPIINSTHTINDIINFIPQIQENTVIAITSKIISIIQKRVIPMDQIAKLDLIKQESDTFLGAQTDFPVYLTIKNDIVIATAGIDHSNSANQAYILWPENPFQVCQEIYHLLLEKYGVKNFGVMLTDSRLSLLRKGVLGVCIGFYGFKPLENCIGKPDLFGRALHMTQINNIDALAAIGVFMMRESDESTPIVVMQNVPQLEYEHTTEQSIESTKIALKDDIYLAKLYEKK